MLRKSIVSLKAKIIMGKISNIIKNPGVIGQYVKGVFKARQEEQKSFQLAFNREKDGGWYIDLPEWQGAHANLAMVAGADKLLDFVGCGDSRVEVEVIKSDELIDRLEQGPEYFRCDRLSQSTFGGATYQVNLDGFNRTMWLCPVTLFVLGEYPKYLYIENLRARRADEGLCAALSLSTLQDSIAEWKFIEEDYLRNPDSYEDLTRYDENGKPYMLLDNGNKMYMTNLGFDEYLDILHNNSSRLLIMRDPVAINFQEFLLNEDPFCIHILMGIKKFVKE